MESVKSPFAENKEKETLIPQVKLGPKQKRQNFIRVFRAFIEREMKSNPQLIIRNNFIKFMSDLKDYYNKGKYRKCLNEISEKEKVFEEFEENWRIHEMKVNCIMRIIEKKIVKYAGSGSNNIKGLEGWLKRIDEEIKIWFEFIHNSQSKSVDICIVQLEICIRLVLQQCYNYALEDKNNKQLADCAGFLGLGLRLLNFSSEFTSDADSLNISQKILLFISSLLIADKDFEKAKLFQADALRLSYRELNYRIDLEENVDIKSLSKTDQFYLDKIFMNIVTAFYQIGVCEENLGNIVKAIEAYKQSKWFAMNFIKQAMPELTQFIFDVEKRAINYHLIIENAQSQQEICKKEKGVQQKNNKKVEIYYDELNTLKKFDNTIKMIENMKIENIEEDEVRDGQSEFKKTVLSTVTLIDNLMSDKFRDFLMESDKIEVTKMDREKRQKIQRKLNEINAEKVYLEKEQYRKTLLGKEKEKSLNTDTNINYCKTERTTSPTLETEKNKDIANFLERNLFNRPNTGFPSRVLSSTHRKESEIEKINYSGFVFNKTYRKKMQHLDGLMTRELGFQKKLLTLKKCEKLVIDDFDQRKVKETCEFFFKKNLGNKGNLFKNENINKKKEILNEVNLLKEREKLKIESRVLSSLSSKAFNDYKAFNRVKNTSEFKLRKEFLTESSNAVPDDKEIEQQNTKLIYNLDNQIQNMNKYEDSLLKKVHPYSSKLNSKRVSTFTIRNSNEKFLKK